MRGCSLESDEENKCEATDIDGVVRKCANLASRIQIVYSHISLEFKNLHLFYQAV